MLFSMSLSVHWFSPIISKALVYDDTVEIQPISRHHFKLKFKATEASHNTREAEGNIWHNFPNWMSAFLEWILVN